VLRVYTSARLAIRKLILVATLAAAVTTIPSTGTIVIVIITPAVACEIRCATLAITVRVGLVSRIDALALFTVRILVFITTDTTAITAIPVAAAIIVIIIAVAIAGPSGRTTLANTTRIAMTGIQAFAGFAVGKLEFVTRCAAAIPTIPIATTDIVAVVAALITLERRV